MRSEEACHVLWVAFAEITIKFRRAGYPITSVHVWTVPISVMKLLLSNNNLASHIVLEDRVGVRRMVERVWYVEPGLRGTVTCEAEWQEASL